ncbi:MAG: hypothetical protein ACLP5H_07520 [Desulfomonilaceae bacterium]
MPKIQLSAREILRDIRSRIDDTGLTAKYHLSAQGLQRAFNKPIAAGVLKQSELDDGVPSHERAVNLAWKCPASGKPQPPEFEECPARLTAFNDEPAVKPISGPIHENRTAGWLFFSGIVWRTCHFVRLCASEG